LDHFGSFSFIIHYIYEITIDLIICILTSIKDAFSSGDDVSDLLERAEAQEKGDNFVEVAYS